MNKDLSYSGRQDFKFGTLELSVDAEFAGNKLKSDGEVFPARAVIRFTDTTGNIQLSDAKLTGPARFDQFLGTALMEFAPTLPSIYNLEIVRATDRAAAELYKRCIETAVDPSP